MKHYKIVVSVNLSDSQKDELRPFLSNLEGKKFNSLGLAMAYVKRVENEIGQCYRNYYMRYYFRGRSIFVYELLLVGRMDGLDFACIGVKEVES